jgi:hypothetical protein
MLLAICKSWIEFPPLQVVELFLVKLTYTSMHANPLPITLKILSLRTDLKNGLFGPQIK